MTVISDLGGGQFGHLGLVLTPGEYALVSNVPFVRPIHSGALNIPQGTAHHEAVRLRDEHHENIRVFRETLQVEKALIKQIVVAVDPEYLRELRNEMTNTITLTVPEILDHLITCYGQVDSTTLDKEEQKMKTYMWNVNDTPVTFYNLVEDLAALAIAARLKKSQAQIISVALDIVRRTGDFEKALMEWLTRPIAQHTWINFKQHFSTAYRELKRIRGPTMRNSAFHQVNQVVEQLNDNFHQIRDEIIQSVNAITLTGDRDETIETSSPPESTPTMNEANDTNAQLLRLVQQMQTQLDALSNNNVRNHNGGRNSSNGRRNQNSGRTNNSNS